MPTCCRLRQTKSQHVIHALSRPQSTVRIQFPLPPMYCCLPLYTNNLRLVVCRGDIVSQNRLLFEIVTKHHRRALRWCGVAVVNLRTHESCFKLIPNVASFWTPFSERELSRRPLQYISFSSKEQREPKPIKDRKSVV